MYKAKCMDTDKAVEYLKECRRDMEQQELLEVEKTRKYYEGIRKGLRIAEDMYYCSNYEKANPRTFEDGVKMGFDNAFYGIGKELGIKTQDICAKEVPNDEKCKEFSARIQKRLKPGGSDDSGKE